MKTRWFLGTMLLVLAVPAIGQTTSSSAGPGVAQHVMCSSQATNPIVCSLPQAVQAGQLIYVATRYNASLSVSGVSDNCSAGASAYTQDPHSPLWASDWSTGLAVYYADGVHGGACTISVNYPESPNPGSVEVVVLNGVWASGAWDASAGATFTTATATPSAGSVTTTAANDVLVEAVALLSSDSYAVTGSYGLLNVDTSWGRMAAAAEVAAVPGSYAGGLTLGSATTGAALLTAFKASVQPPTAVLQLLWDDGTSVAGTAKLFLEGTQEAQVDSKALDSTGTVSTTAALDPTQSYKLTLTDPTGTSLGEELSAPMPQAMSSGVLTLLGNNKFIVTLHKSDHSVASAKLAPR